MLTRVVAAQVSVCNRSPDKVDATVERAKAEGDLPLVGFKDMASFVGSISKPRRIIILVKVSRAATPDIQLMAGGDHR